MARIHERRGATPAGGAEGPLPRRQPIADVGVARAHGPGPPEPMQRLAATIGNGGFAAVVMRAPRTAASTGAAARLAPSGPLAQLRDELDDTNVDEGKCLRLLGQLGPGERTLFGRDQTLMGQMAEAFNAGEMSRAVELLDLRVAWQVYWLRRAVDLEDVPQTVLARLLDRAPGPELGNLLAWDEGRNDVRRVWQGDPLRIAAVAGDPVRTRNWLGTPGFLQWALERSGMPAIVQWIAANDPAATLVSMRGPQLTTLLEAIRDQPAIRPALRRLFVASRDADVRRRLYRIRFGAVPAGLDLLADGEQRWLAREAASGTGGDRASVRAAVAAGGPANVTAAIGANARSPLAALRDELDDTNVNEGRCLRLIGRLTDREALLLTRDRTMMAQLASAFDGDEISHVLGLIGHLMTVRDAVLLVVKADVAGDVGRAAWNGLLARATADDLAAIIRSTRAFAALKRVPGMRPTQLAPLLADVAVRDQVVQGQGQFLDWVIGTSGEASALLWLVSTRSPATFFAALVASARRRRFVEALPLGSAMPPADRTALRLLFLSGTDVPAKVSMLNRRYNLERTGEDTANAGAGTFESATLDRIWDVLARLPEQDVADNAWLKELTRRTNPSAPTPQGVTGDNRVAVGYDPTALGAAETGAFTDPGDLMRGTNLFDTNLVHEMAHASDRQYRWTRDGGPFDVRPELGAWRDHRLDYSAIIDRLATDTALATTFPAARDLADVKTALVDAMTNLAVSAEAGFRNQAGASYGVGADRWRPLWVRARGHAIVAAVQDGQAARAPWNNPPAAVAGRIYHDTDYNYWASYNAATRAGGKLSRYQFRDKRDFFAELYATYYETAPADPGRLVRTWNNAVYTWFRDAVDRGRETRTTP